MSKLPTGSIFNRIDTIFVCLCVMILFCPAFSSLFVRVFRGVGWYACFSCLALVSVVYAWRQRTKVLDESVLSFFAFAILYILINLMRIAMGIDDGANSNTIWMIQNLIIFVCAIHINNNPQFERIILTILLISFLINTIFTFKVLDIDPNASKSLATGASESQIDTAVTYFGVIGYDLVYADVFILPIIATIVFSSSLRAYIRAGLGMVACLMVIRLFRCGYLTSLLMLAISAVLIAYFLLLSRVKYLMLPIVGSFVLTAVNPQEIAKWLLRLSHRIDVFTIQERLIQIARYILHGERGDTLARLDLYGKSIRSFSEHPLFGQVLTGNATPRLSGHSEILDMMALGGLFLLSIFLKFVFELYRRVSRCARNDVGKAVARSLFITYILFNIIDVSWSCPVILFTITCIVPMFLKRINN